MSGTIWIKHPDVDGIIEVPTQSLPIYRQSGWYEATRKDVAAHDKAHADGQAAAEQAMTDAATKNTTTPDAAGRDDNPRTKES